MNVRNTAGSTILGSHELRLALWVGLVAALSLGQYAARAAEGKPDRDVLYRYSTAYQSAVGYAVILLLVLGIAWFRRDLLALRRPRSWSRALGLCILLLVAIFVAQGILEPLLHGGNEQGLTPRRWEPSHAGAYAANFVAVAAVAPIVEELTFRGLGFTLLVRFGPWVAVVVVGLAFALTHGLLNALPELALFGCALAWLRWQTDSVFPGMILHALFNGAALVAAVTLST